MQRSLLCLVLATLLGCDAAADKTQPGASAGTANHELASSAPEQASSVPAAGLPRDLLDLFARIDEFGSGDISKGRYVRLTLSGPEGDEDREIVEDAWLIDENKAHLTVHRKDLIPWTFNRESPTTVPASWSPSVLRIKSVEDADFEAVCKEMSQPEPEPADEDEKFRSMSRRAFGDGPSARLLVAHAAWKKGLSAYCLPIVAQDPAFKEDRAKYAAAVLDDLAWLHYLRGVNLLMFADRKDVLPHLRLATKLAPKNDHAAAASDLIKHLERLAAAPAPKPVDESPLGDAEKATLYVSQLKDLHCAQFSQPGWISPYEGVIDGKPTDAPPSARLAKLGTAAVPALIKALEDDTPTRTVYHWRDFARSRKVWRVSDFAWTILRDVSAREFGNRRIVGFTFSSMSDAEKKAVIAEITKWHAETKDLSPDDRMLSLLSSRESDDWLTAGRYFLGKKDNRAVPELLKKIPEARAFTQGDLCELVARFGDPSAKPAILAILNKAEEPADRISAAIALWDLGDKSGVPVVINYVKAENQPYGSWDDPIWFLMRTHTPEGLEALTDIVTKGPAKRAGEVIGFMKASITGDLWGKEREPAGSVEICPVLIAAMSRTDKTEHSVNNVNQRIKDLAATCFALLRQPPKDRFRSRFAEPDPGFFHQVEPDEAARDAQIEALIKWYGDHKKELAWDAKKGMLTRKMPE